MNFNPACAASQRLPQPGHRGGTGLGEDEAGWGRTNCELPLPESRRRRGQTRPLAPSEREARESRARLARRCAPGPGRAARSPRCPFGRGQLPAAAVQPPCAPAQVTRGIIMRCQWRDESQSQNPALQGELMVGKKSPWRWLTVTGRGDKMIACGGVWVTRKIVSSLSLLSPPPPLGESFVYNMSSNAL